MPKKAFYDMVDEVEQELANYQRVTEHSNTGYSNGTSEEVKLFVLSLSDSTVMEKVVSQIASEVEQLNS